ncbi:MAG TPA: ATP-binding protein [Polyangiaceae bacterium]|nr:ATP-binding protein [Polyangiaceae bacterium]
MSNDRLTRQELSWLLAQEARGAARALREGVIQLKQPELRDNPPRVETTLDALDDAIGRLSELQAGGRGAPRRGRIDLAALLYQVAPSARIAMKPGDGTEVSGEENELRRMLHVLVNQTNSNPSDAAPSASPEVRIRREEDWVKISVELGPDASATAELERRWLSRMTLRHGGRLELEGGTQTIVLPADGSGEEVHELRKELVQAQQLGEAYARELAAVFAREQPVSEAPPADAPISVQRFEILKSVASALLRPMRGWLDAARTDAGLATEALGEQAQLTRNLLRRTTSGHELLGELNRVAECPVNEAARRFDLAALAREEAALAQARAARQGVQVQADLPENLEFEGQRSVVALLLRALLDHAILATPREGTVCLRLARAEGSVEVSTEDGGPAIPEAARADLLRQRVNPSSFGRPADLSLLIAEAASACLGSGLALEESTSGKTITRAMLRPQAFGAGQE